MSMPTPAQPDEEVVGKGLSAEHLATAIGVSVMKALGRPTDLFRISVVRLWSNRYRVNVQTGPDAVSARVAHSFFLEADAGGAVVASNPVISRMY